MNSLQNTMDVMRTTALVLIIAAGVGLAATAAYAGPAKPRTVDSGTFGVFVRGQRVATENFQIQNSDAGSIATSEFKTQSGEKASHKTELQLTASGELRRYDWREITPGKAHLSIEPSEDFLLERIAPNPPEKASEHPFMLPRSSMVLDDYVFSHREILAWRYLAQACNGKLQDCHPGSLQFGVLVPQQRTSMLVTVEYVGPEKVTLGGKERELNRLNLKAEDADWVLYLDGNLKLVRIAIPAEQTEVIRDQTVGN
jgi:hypothetical protein